MTQSNSSITKMRVRTKARPKPSRANTKFCSSMSSILSCWCDVSSSGLRKHCLYGLAICNPRGLTRAGSTCCLQPSTIAACSLGFPFTASCLALSELLSGTLPLLHNFWPCRPFQIWVEASMTFQVLNSESLQNQNHIGDAKVWNIWGLANF
jgi:hypothetical protein